MSRSYTTDRTPITFDVDGETFTARRIPGPLFVDFFRKRQEAKDEELAEMLFQAFSAAMEPDEFERFWRLYIPIDTLQEIFQDLTQDSAGRPTKPSSPSLPGRRRAKAAAGSSAVASMSNGSKTSGTSAT